MFYLTVVLEKGNVIDRGLNAENEGEFVVHFDGSGSHGMLDAGPLDARVEVVADLVVVVCLKFPAEKSGNVLRFDGVNGSAGQMVVNSSQVCLPLEDDVGCVFGLHDAPMILQVELFDDGTIGLSKRIELFVKGLHLEGIAQSLSLAEISDGGKGIVHEVERDVVPGQGDGKPRVSVEIDLQAKGTPCRDANISESQFFIDEVKIVVETLAVGCFEKCLMGDFVMPRLVGLTRLHCREDVNKPGVGATVFENVANAVFFAEVLLADEFDFNAAFPSDALGIVSEFITQRLGKTRIIKNSYVMVTEKESHSVRITESGKSSRNDHSIKARQDPGNILSVALSQQFHRYLTPFF